MNQLSPNKNRRPRAVAHERGAAVFVVMMAVLVLTGVGVWSIRSASLTDLASGNARAGAQTLSLAEMAIVSGATYLSTPSMADAQHSAAAEAEANGAAETDDCWSVQDGEYCKNIVMSEVDEFLETRATLTGRTPYTLLDQVGAEGSLGAEPQIIEADIRFEMTDGRDIDVAGTSGTKKGTYKLVTFTSYAIIRPIPAGTARAGEDELCNQTNSLAQNSMASQVGMRARSMIGPITKK